jgi:hypothetical protein
MESPDPTPTQLRFDVTQDPSSPFYLHPMDNPSSVVITPLLEGAKNYNIWSRQMARSLSCKYKLGFVTKTIPEPPINDPLHSQWQKCNNMVISWITTSVSVSIAQSIAFFDKASDLWQELRDRFSTGDSFRFSDMLAVIHSIRQGDYDLATYYTKLQMYWQELEVLRPVITCVFHVPCTCPMATCFKTYRDNEYAVSFLKGLNETYDSMHRQIFCMTPFP